ncbi:MAG: transcription elongation factor GreB [Nannocystaceae bacterium]|nr:transcription elongation factor GreB [Myxococcales bacterium]
MNDGRGQQSVTDYITPEGYAALKAEVDHLWRVERPQVTRDVSAAAELGDRSENADYIYGKRRLREIDRRLRFLGKRMDALTVVRVRPNAEGRVTFGAWVRVEDEDGEERCYRLVGAEEFDVERGMISVSSPMGRALLGKQVDDEVEVDRPRGRATFTILAVSFEDPDGPAGEAGEASGV